MRDMLAPRKSETLEDSVSDDAFESADARMDERKKKSLSLLSQHRKWGKGLSDEDLEQIAFSIYCSALRAACNLPDSAIGGVPGWRNPYSYIFDAVREEYGFEQINGEFPVEVTRLANPAFWFASDHIYPRRLEKPCISHEKVKNELSEEQRKIKASFIWRADDRLPVNPGMVARYMSEFFLGHPEKRLASMTPLSVYMTANLKKALEYEKD